MIYKQKVLTLTFLLVIFITTMLAASPFRMIEVNDPLLEDYTFIVRSSDESVLSFTPPLSRDEMVRSLQSISKAGRSQSWMAAYNRIQKALAVPPVFQENALGLTVHPELAVEGRWRSNVAMPWLREEASSPALITLPLEFFFANIFYARGDLIVRNDPSFYNTDQDQIGSNILSDIARIDLNIPLRSYISAGGPWWNIQLGRDKVSFGSGITGNLALSDTPDYYDFFRLSLFSTNFKYSFFITQLPLVTPAYFYADGFEALRGASFDATTQRYLYMHRWDIRLWKRVSIGISEGVLIGNSPLELRFLNPLTVYHSFFSWNDYPMWGTAQGDMAGSLASLDVEWALGGGISLYGQMVMNQYQTPYELENFGEAAAALPNGLGWLGGIQINHDIYGWRSLFYLEGVYTDPYVYTLSSPFASFIWMRRLSATVVKDLRYAWIGYPEGRDVIVVSMGAKVHKATVSYDFSIMYKNKGEHSLRWDWEKGLNAVAQKTPTGNPEQSLTVAGELQWSVIPPLSLVIGAAVCNYTQYQHVPGISLFGAEVYFNARYIF